MEITLYEKDVCASMAYTGTPPPPFILSLKNIYDGLKGRKGREEMEKSEKDNQKNFVLTS